MLRYVTAASLVLAITSMQFRYSEMCIRCSEWSLPCDNVMHDVNVELLCLYVNVCLVRIDSCDDVMFVVYVGILAQAYTCDIANETLRCDMMPKYWVICELN